LNYNPSVRWISKALKIQWRTRELRFQAVYRPSLVVKPHQPLIQQLGGERTELEIAVTNALSTPLQGLPVGLSPSRPRLFRYAPSALVTSEHPQCAARAAGFRLWLGGGRYGPAAFRYALLSALRSTGSLALFADTQTEAYR
jgi:hypothetical protein